MMNNWKLEYYHDIEDWFEQLTKDKLKAIAKELKLLQLCGNSLRLPHSKALGKKLFELRERNFGLRMYYTFSSNRKIVLLHGGDKATQKQDIKLARNMLNKME